MRPESRLIGKWVAGFSAVLLMIHGYKSGLAVDRRKNTVFVEAGLAGLRPFRERPLLRPLLRQQGIGQARDVEIASPRCFTMFVENRFGIAIGKELLYGGMVQLTSETLREFDGNGPIMTRLTRRIDGGKDARDASFRIRHRPGFLPPGAGGQQQIGISGGIRIAVSLLQDDKLGSLQCLAHLGLVRQRLCGVGTGNPDGLDLTAF